MMTVRQIFFKGMMAVVWSASSMLFCAEQKQQQLAVPVVQQNEVHDVVLIFSADDNKEVCITREQAQCYKVLRDCIGDSASVYGQECRFPVAYGTVKAFDKLNKWVFLFPQDFMACLESENIPLQELLEIAQLASFLDWVNSSMEANEKWNMLIAHLGRQICSEEDCADIEKYGDDIISHNVAHTMLRKAAPQPLHCLREVKDTEPVYVKGFSSCGRFFVTVNMVYDPQRLNVINVWDKETGSIVRTFECKVLYDISLSHDGLYLLIVTRNEENMRTVDVMNISTGECEQSIETSVFAWIVSAVFNKNDTSILMIVNNNEAKSYSVKIWNGQAGEYMCNFEHSVPILTATFNNDETMVLTTSKDAVARIWDVTTGCVVKTFNCRNVHDYHVEDTKIYKAQFVFNDTKVLTHSSLGVVTIWDIKTGEACRRIDAGDWKTAALFSLDGKLVAVTDKYDAKTVQIHDTNTGNVMCKSDMGNHVDLGAFISDEKLVTYYSHDCSVAIRDIKTGNRLSHFYCKTCPEEGMIFVSPDGSCFVMGLDIFELITQDVVVFPVQAWHLVKLFEIPLSENLEERKTYIKDHADIFVTCSETLKKKLKLMGLDVDVLCSGILIEHV